MEGKLHDRGVGFVTPQSGQVMLFKLNYTPLNMLIMQACAPATNSNDEVKQFCEEFERSAWSGFGRIKNRL